MAAKSLPDRFKEADSIVNSYLASVCQSTVQSADQEVTPVSLLVQSALRLTECGTEEAMDSAKLILKNASPELIEAMPVRVFRSIFTEVYEAHLPAPPTRKRTPQQMRPQRRIFTLPLLLR